MSVVAELPQGSNLQTEALSLPESGSTFIEAKKNNDTYEMTNGPICEESVDAESHVVQKEPVDVETNISRESESNSSDFLAFGLLAADAVQAVSIFKKNKRKLNQVM